jgi:hypothetical protein
MDEHDTRRWDRSSLSNTDSFLGGIHEDSRMRGESCSVLRHAPSVTGRGGSHAFADPENESDCVRDESDGTIGAAERKIAAGLVDAIYL